MAAWPLKGASVEGFITTEQAAPLIGKSERTTRRYVLEGQLEGFKDDDGHYLVSLISISRWLAAQAPSSDGDVDWDEERKKQDALYKQLNVALKQLELDERLGRLHRAEHVRDATLDLIYAQRSAMAALPGKLAPIITGETDEAVVAARIDEEVRAIQDDLARHEYDPAYYRKRLDEERGKVDFDD